MSMDTKRMPTPSRRGCCPELPRNRDSTGAEKASASQTVRGVLEVPAAALSEHETRSELTVSWGVRLAADHSKAAGAECMARGPEPRSIQEVEKLGSHFDKHTLPDREAFGDPLVEVVDARHAATGKIARRVAGDLISWV